MGATDKKLTDLAERQTALDMEQLGVLIGGMRECIDQKNFHLAVTHSVAFQRLAGALGAAQDTRLMEEEAAKKEAEAAASAATALKAK